MAGVMVEAGVCIELPGLVSASRDSLDPLSSGDVLLGSPSSLLMVWFKLRVQRGAEPPS